MRTRHLLALSSTLALMAPAVAQAAPHKVKESPASVRAYWTPERMRSAIPMVRERGPVAPAKKPGTAGGPTTAAFSDTLVPLGELEIQPVSTNGRVFFYDGTARYSCSGTSVTSGNESVVLTAGHCVNEGPGDFYTKWTFVPGYNNGNAPMGTWSAIELDTTAAWEGSGDFGKDVGAAVVTGPDATTLTDAVGARGVHFNHARTQDYLLHGYPAEGKFNGSRLYVSKTKWLRDDTSTTPATMGVSTDFNGGSSGGSWVEGTDYMAASALVASVNSYTYRGLKNTMFGPYLESDKAYDDAGDLLTRAGGFTVSG